MKVYEKSNHLIIAIEKTPENYLEAVELRNQIIGNGRFVGEVTALDRIIQGWAAATKEGQ